MVEVKQIIKTALGLKDKAIKDNDGPGTLEEWDSLGHLSVLNALDKAFDGKVAAIENFAQVKTVKEIVQLLKKEGLI